MKKSPLELKLEQQELARLQMLEQATDDVTRGKLLDEIKLLNEMRDGLEEHRIDKRNRWLEPLIKGGMMSLTTIALTYIGLAHEQLNGNPTGFMVKWLINRTPR